MKSCSPYCIVFITQQAYTENTSSLVNSVVAPSTGTTTAAATDAGTVTAAAATGATAAAATISTGIAVGVQTEDVESLKVCM
jgi:hypothetical protein